MKQINFRSVFLASFLILLFVFPTGSAYATQQRPSLVDLDCADFGTRERAQAEYWHYAIQRESESSRYDPLGLDADDDGQACENNPSTGKWSFLVAGMSLVIGKYWGYRKRNGHESVVPGVKGLFYSWSSLSQREIENGDVRRHEFDETGIFLLVSGLFIWFPISLLRDSILPLTTSPFRLFLLVGCVGYVIAYVAALKTDWF